MARFKTPFEVDIEEVPKPKPGPNEVLIRVMACAICASDAEIIRGGNPNPGHEIAGVVEEVGEGVKRVKAGDRVTIYWKLGCGECPYCRAGFDVHCERPRYLAWNGYGEYVVAHEEACLPLPEGVDFIEGSLLTDTLGTPYAAVMSARVSGERVAVWGCGPLGLMCVQLCLELGARDVIAVDPISSRREMALKLGASLAVDPTAENPVEALRKFAPPLGPRVAICATRSDDAGRAAMNGVPPEGRVVYIAGQPGELDRHRWAYRIHYFKRTDYESVAELASRRGVRLKELVSHTYPLERVREAFEMRFRNPHKSLKVVVLPHEGC